ncbi:MAG: HD-GYP domain-containing protein [Thermoanaerobaculia bacterium]
MVVSILLLSSTHLAVGVGTHRLHVIHVVFRGLYLLPIIAGALWFGARGGIMASLAVSAAYLGHILLSWPKQPMENANQFAMIGVYLVVGAVSGILVDRQERERSRRLEAERRAQREAIVEGIASLANALGFRDEYTREHSERVARLAVEIGRRRGLSGEPLERLRLASMMHDVGKIGVRDDILFKPEHLTPEERTKIERHPVLAAEILRPIHGTREIAEIVLSHHECPDGSGYPRGLRGDQIPVEARILRVADVFSALTDARSYKPAMDARSVLAWMLAKEGTKLDQESVRALRSLVNDGKADTVLAHPDSTGPRGSSQ